MDSLVPELLAQIFKQTVSAPDDDLYDWLRHPEKDRFSSVDANDQRDEDDSTLHRRVDWNDLSDEPLRSGITAHPTNTLTPLDLSHVSAVWRAIAFSMPELWSTIFITDDHLPGAPRILKIYLRNSRSLPVDVTFRDGSNSPLMTHTGPIFAESLRLVFAQSERWRSFKFHLRRLRHSDSIRQFPSLLDVVAPNLQTVSIDFQVIMGVSPTGSTHLGILANFARTSSKLYTIGLLEKTYLPSEPLEYIAFNRFTRLTLTDAWMVQNAEFLHGMSFRCDALETLEISAVLGRGRSTSANTSESQTMVRTIRLPSLRNMSIVGHRDAMGIPHLIRNIHASRLETLAIRIVEHEDAKDEEADDAYRAVEYMFPRVASGGLSIAVLDLDGRPAAKRRPGSSPAAHASRAPWC